MPIGRTAPITQFAVELDGHHAGFVSKFSGGAAHADVVNEPSGRKHLGAVHFEDMVFACGPGMSKAFYDWVSDSSDMSGGAHRKDGEILACDFNFKVRKRLEWRSGMITAIGLPALDAASKDAAQLTLKLSPEYTRMSDGDGSAVHLSMARQQAWLGSNFRLKIDGLEQACARVSRISPIAITNDVLEAPMGATRITAHDIGRTSYSDLVITLPESAAEPFYDWFDDFVIKGNSGPSQEKNGTLELLTPNLKGALFTLKFSNLGIYQITEPSTGSISQVRKIDVKMYCEDIRLTASAAASGAK